MPPGGFEALVGLALAGLVLALLLGPAYRAGKDVSGAVDVEARRSAEGVRVRLSRFPLTRSVVVRSVAVSRELADELGLEVPEDFRFAQDLRWLAAEGRLRLGDEPVEILFRATREPTKAVTGSVRILSSYRPGLRRLRHYAVKPVRGPSPGSR